MRIHDPDIHFLLTTTYGWSGLIQIQLFVPQGEIYQIKSSSSRSRTSDLRISARASTVLLSANWAIKGTAASHSAVARREAGTRARPTPFTHAMGSFSSLRISGLLGNIGLPKEKPCKLYFSLYSMRQKLVAMIYASVRSISSICFPFSALSALLYLLIHGKVHPYDQGTAQGHATATCLELRNRQPINKADLNNSEL